MSGITQSHPLRARLIALCVILVVPGIPACAALPESLGAAPPPAPCRTLVTLEDGSTVELQTAAGAEGER